MTRQLMGRRELLKAAGAGVVGSVTLSSRASAQTTADGPVVYTGSEDGTIYALDATDGTELWSFAEPSGRSTTSPTVVDGTVYVGHDDLYALDARNGDLAWTFDGGGEVRTSPTVVDGTVFVCGATAADDIDAVYTIDAATGSRAWSVEVPRVYDPQAPTVVDDTVYVGSDSVHAIDTETSEERWRFEPDLDEYEYFKSPAVVDGTVFAGADRLYAIDGATGDREWTSDDLTIGGNKGDNKVTTPPVVVGGSVFVGTVHGLFAIDRTYGYREWTANHGSVEYAPTVANGTVYFEASGRLYAVEGRSGAVQWMFRTDEYLGSVPTVYEGTVYVTSEARNVYAIDIDSGTQSWTFERADPHLETGSCSPTVVADTTAGSSADSRVLLGTLGHHDDRDNTIGEPIPDPIGPVHAFEGQIEYPFNRAMPYSLWTVLGAGGFLTLWTLTWNRLLSDDEDAPWAH